MYSEWNVVKGSDVDALAIVDGLGIWSEYGPHYSRQTPGSKTFTGVGKQIVLMTEDKTAIWACVYQMTPGVSKVRQSQPDIDGSRWVFRNMMFRNLGNNLSSELIAAAVKKTYEAWIETYGELPTQRLRTEVAVSIVKSKNPGYCYLCAGWEKGLVKRGKLFLYAPIRDY